MSQSNDWLDFNDEYVVIALQACACLRNNFTTLCPREIFTRTAVACLQFEIENTNFGQALMISAASADDDCHQFGFQANAPNVILNKGETTSSSSGTLANP